MHDVPIPIAERSVSERRRLAFAYSITDSRDNDNLTVIQDSVGQGSGEGGIVVECFCPLDWRSVGGDNHRTGLISRTEHLKQDV